MAPLYTFVLESCKSRRSSVETIADSARIPVLIFRKFPSIPTRVLS